MGLTNEAGLQPSTVGVPSTWGAAALAPGWYHIGPLALKQGQATLDPLNRDATHT